MPSPDFSQYVDLTIYDKDPGQIYLDAITYAQNVALPEFNPRAGTIEDALLQATSYATSELAGAINRLPDGLLEGLLNLYGFERQQSVSARLTVQVTLTDSSGGTVPSGALFSYTTEGENGLETFFFATVADLTIASGSSSGTVETEALTVGIIPTIDSGTVLTPVSGVAKVLTAISSGTMTQGEDEETDISYFTRAAAFLASRSNSLATSTQMRNFLTTYLLEVQRAYISDLTYFRYMRVSSVTRTGSTVTAVVSGLGAAWDTPNDDITFLPADVTAGVTRVIVRYVDDALADAPINGTEVTSGPYVIQTSVYNSGAGTYTITFTTDISSDSGVTYQPKSTAPHGYQNAGQATPNDHYIEILLLPEPTEVGTEPGDVGLVFGNSIGLPIQDTGYSNIQTALADKSVAGLKFTSIAPLLVPISINVSVEHAPTFGAVAVRDAVKEALAAYVSPSNWQFGAKIYVNNLIGIAASVNGVSRVASLTLSIPSGTFSDLGTYYSADGGYVQFRYPFCLPSPALSSGLVSANGVDQLSGIVVTGIGE